MTLDGGIHHLGTEPIHMLPVFVALGVGVAFDSAGVVGFGIGMGLVLLFGTMRCRAPYYRWRVRDAGPREGEADE